MATKEGNMEDKQAICDALAATLRLTRNHSDLDRIEYENDEELGLEFATSYWNGGTLRRTNVTMDSGSAMIRDIMKVID